MERQGGLIALTLDIIVRGTGSSRSASDHIAAVLSEYQGAAVILYGGIGGEVTLPVPVRSASDPGALESVLKGMEAGAALVYGDESLLALAQEMEPDLIWITLGPDANGVREIWRVRQQHSWLSQRKLGLLIEQTPDGVAPDTERLMRLSRATRAVLVPMSAANEAAPALETEAASAPVAEDAAAVPAAPVGIETPSDEMAAAPATSEAAPVESEAAPVESEAVPEVTAAPPRKSAQAERAAEPSTAPAPARTRKAKGADVGMENEVMDRPQTGAAPNAQAEQALMQRYALVKERRATSSRVAQVETALQGLLKEIFVARFASGPDEAAAFEALSRKLTDTAAEFTQLSKALSNIEAQLAKLDWLKDELEI